MPSTSRRVRVVMGKDSGRDDVHPDQPVVLVDGELLYGVTRIQIDHSYSKGLFQIGVTLMGVDVDLEGAPDYLVKVLGPKPKKVLGTRPKEDQ